MRCFALFLFAIAAYGQTVTILRTHQPSHGSVSVDFTFSGSGNASRAHLSTAGGSCTSGSTGTFSIQNNSVGTNNRKYWPYDDGTTSPIVARVLFSGLLPGTTYQLCPEVSADGGATWSSGVGVSYTTPAFPAIHPVPPIAPATFDTTYPDTSAYTSVSPTCANVPAEITNALNRQITTGTVINVPDCSGVALNFYGTQTADHIDFISANVNTSLNTIGIVSYPGGTCGGGAAAGQVPCLAEGMGVRFGSMHPYSIAWPHNLRDYGYGSSQVIPYIFYIHYPTAGDTTNFQLFYPQPYSQCSSCLWALGDAGSSNAGNPFSLVEWPRPLKWIVLRTPTADSAFAPLGTRITPAWDTKMAHLSNWGISTSYDNAMPQSGNIRFEGLHLSYVATGQVSPQPITVGSPLNVRQDAGPIIFSRTWFEGPTYPDRVGTLASYFDGSNIAMIDSRIDKMAYWHSASTWSGISPYGAAGITNTTSGTSFQIGPGEIHGGLFNYVQTGTMHITISGVPTAGRMEGIVYINSSGQVHVGLPAGVTGTTDIGVTENSIVQDNGAGHACDINQAIVPKGGNGRATVLPIACFFVSAAGVMDGLFPFSVFDSSNDQNGNEGSDTIVSGRGPGPWIWRNNYLDGNGNFLHFDDCLNSGTGCEHDIGDVTIQRNTFNHDYAKVRSSASWTGTLFVHRHGLEWKHGSRNWIAGNIFAGPAGCDGTDGTGTTIIPKTSAGDVNDLNMENNVVYQSCGFSAFGTYYSTNQLLADAMSRIRFANNLVYNISGWKWDSYYTITAPVWGGQAGWLFQTNGGAEDVQIIHNTFLDYDGNKPFFMTVSTPTEGLKIDDNLLFYNTNRNAGGMFGIDNYLGFCSTGQFDKALLDCMYPNYTFNHNVVVPGWNSTNIQNTACNSGFDGDPCFTRRSMTADTQVSTSTLTSGLGALPSTILNLQAGVPAAIASLGFMNPSTGSYGSPLAYLGGADYTLKSSSTLISGGVNHASDGKDVGADMTALGNAVGVVKLIGPSGITATSALISFIAPDAQACPVDFSSSDATVITTFTRATDSGTTAGPRSVALGGLAAHTAYTYRVNCAVMQPMGVFRTP